MEKQWSSILNAVAINGHTSHKRSMGFIAIIMELNARDVIIITTI